MKPTPLNTPTEQKDYEAYVDRVESPLSYPEWIRATKQLDRLLNGDPHGYNRAADKPIKELCQKLGV